jgi:hypothetical protein
MTFFIPLVFQIGALISMSIFYEEPDSKLVDTIWNRFTQLNYIFSAVFVILATSWSTIREGSSTIFSRGSRSNASSLDHMIGLQEIKSKGDGSADGDQKVKGDEREHKQQATLLEILFPNQYNVDDDGEEVEELRTTQCDASNHVYRVESRLRSTR